MGTFKRHLSHIRSLKKYTVMIYYVIVNNPLSFQNFSVQNKLPCKNQMMDSDDV